MDDNKLNLTLIVKYNAAIEKYNKSKQKITLNEAFVII